MGVGARAGGRPVGVAPGIGEGVCPGAVAWSPAAVGGLTTSVEAACAPIEREVSAKPIKLRTALREGDMD